MNVSRYKVTIIVVAAIALLAVFFQLPLTFTHKIDAAARILPAREWILQRGNDGSLMATMRNHRNALVENYSVVQVERGDAVQFRFSSKLETRERISLGDTIGAIHSNEVVRQLARQRGNLSQAQATLDLYLSGEKAAVVEEARRKWALSREKATLQKEILARQEELFKKDLISREAYEITKNTADVYQLEAGMARAQLQTVKTGAKPEQIQLIRFQIQSIKDEIRVLENRIRRFTLLAPFDGRIIRTPARDTLLIVNDTAMVALIPVNINHFPEIQTGRTVQFNVNSAQSKIRGQIIRVNKNLMVLNGEQVFTAIAEIENYPEHFPLNYITACSISGSRLTPLEYVGRFIKTLFRQ